jgi:hypothetical protein
MPPVQRRAYRYATLGVFLLPQSAARSLYRTVKRCSSRHYGHSEELVGVAVLIVIGVTPIAFAPAKKTTALA